MGTTLTGTTPQDTYDSLIKVTDNGPLSGSLKVLTDGLGNDSTLSLSTTAASIAGTLAVSGNATFDTNTLFVNASTDRVGVGTTAPNTTLSVVTSGAESTISPIVTAQTSTVTYGGLYAIRDGAGDQRGLVLQTYEANVGLAEKVRITSTGNVGIGTNAPAVKLDVVGNIRSSTGILFGSDTAAANALDDYEEGTWTMGVAFGGASVGVTTSLNTGSYVKVGRKVTVTGFLALTSKGSSTGDAAITGLPFAVANLSQNYSSASIWFENVSFLNQLTSFGDVNTTTLLLFEASSLGVVTRITNADFANNSGIMLSFTYFV
jgi:hypothetical protein